MKFTFLLSSDVHVRFIKRIEIIKRSVGDVEAFAFERKGSYPGKKTEFELKILSSISHGSYINRLICILKSINQIRIAIKKTEIIYTFGLDMLFLGWISTVLAFNKKVKLVYEVGDIREVLIGDSIINKIFRLFERLLLKNVSLLVVTSKAFYTEYFLKIQKVKNLKYIEIENKLDPSLISRQNHDSQLKENIELTKIGYFGALRCERTWEILKLLSEKGNGKIKIYIRGIPRFSNPNKIKEIDEFPNIEYGGVYTVPDDLNEIYNSVDVVWACYPYQGRDIGNWMWAKTIRFYESCYFKKPVFVQAGTEDCKVVNQYDIGECLDLENIDKTVDYILNISDANILNWKNNIEKLPQQVYLYSDEHQNLIRLLQD